jgi:hypothetical protein
VYTKYQRKKFEARQMRGLCYYRNLEAKVKNKLCAFFKNPFEMNLFKEEKKT